MRSWGVKNFLTVSIQRARNQIHGGKVYERYIFGSSKGFKLNLMKLSRKIAET